MLVGETLMKSCPGTQANQKVETASPAVLELSRVML